MSPSPPSRRVRLDRVLFAIIGMALAEAILTDILRNATVALHGAFEHHATAIVVLLVIAWMTSRSFREWIRPPCAEPHRTLYETGQERAPQSPRRRRVIAVRPAAGQSAESTVAVTPLTATPAVTPNRPAAAGAARLCTMGPGYADLYARVDPLTRARFVPGEQFVLCGGACGRAYKVATCEHLKFLCPIDHSSLRVS